MYQRHVKELKDKSALHSKRGAAAQLLLKHTDVIANVVSDGSRVPGVILGDASNDLAGKISTNVSSLGRYQASVHTRQNIVLTNCTPVISVRFSSLRTPRALAVTGSDQREKK